MKMKLSKRMISIAFSVMAIGFLILFSFNSCKDFGIPDYKLTIQIKDGVEGTPAAGIYSYKDLALVDYKYTPKNTGTIVEVLVNGSRFSSEGQLTMYNDAILVAQLMDIRGKWKIVMRQPDYTTESVKFIIDFSGTEYLTGTFTDDRGYHGTWTIDSTSNLTITFSDWEDYVLTGDASSMEGDWTGESKTATWYATREE